MGNCAGQGEQAPMQSRPICQGAELGPAVGVDLPVPARDLEEPRVELLTGNVGVIPGETIGLAEVRSEVDAGSHGTVVG